MPTYKRWPITLVEGRGATLTDSEGRSYIDMMAGIAVANVGHGNPQVTAAIASQAERLVHVSNLYSTEPQMQLADRLAALTGGMRSFFCNSGAEAVEAALKLARKWGLANKWAPGGIVVATEGSFHGRTFGALAATGQPSKQQAFQPMLPGFTHVPYGDEVALKEAMGDDVIAILLEPIQGESGVVVPPDGYLEAARRMCDETRALLILDEVQTGLGRTGRWFAHLHTAARPDVMCLAKSLAGGLPMGACLARAEIAESFVPGDHASTFGGGPVQSAAALASLDVIEEALPRVEGLGRRLLVGLEGICGGAATVRGRGLLIGVELQEQRARDIVAAALDAGLLINDATPQVVRFCPPLVITEHEVDAALAIFDKVWRAA